MALSHIPILKQHCALHACEGTRCLMWALLQAPPAPAQCAYRAPALLLSSPKFAHFTHPRECDVRLRHYCKHCLRLQLPPLLSQEVCEAGKRVRGLKGACDPHVGFLLFTARQLAPSEGCLCHGAKNLY
eukprot:scaffold63394_cov24-Tisochrysis_lutea.AAC.2